jgi:hypothetical protein
LDSIIGYSIFIYEDFKLITGIKPKGYTVTNLIKSSGLIADARLLLAAWDESKSIEQNFDTAIRQNILGKASRKRVGDLLRVFKQRYLPLGNVGPAFRTFVNSYLPAEAIDQILYWHTAVTEPALYDFVTEFLFDHYSKGERTVNVNHAQNFLREAIREGKTEGSWDSENTRERVCQGLLSTLRDFHILEGIKRSQEKSIAPPRLHVLAFAYIAFLIKRNEPSGERLINHPDWRLFLLGTRAVERLFTEADAERLLTYQAAGSIIRIEFSTDNFQEYVNALVARSF